MTITKPPRKPGLTRENAQVLADRVVEQWGVNRLYEVSKGARAEEYQREPELFESDWKMHIGETVPGGSLQVGDTVSYWGQADELRKGVVNDILLHDDPVSISMKVVPWVEIHSPTEHAQYLLHIDGEACLVIAADASPVQES